MRLILVLIFIAFAATSMGFEISRVGVHGEKDADIAIESLENVSQTPKLEAKGNEISFFLKGASLDPAMNGHAIFTAPHPLIDKGEFTDEKNGVRGQIWVNGPEKDLAERAKFAIDKGNLHLTIYAPAGDNATLALLKEEQKPLSLKGSSKEAGSLPLKQLWIVALVLVGCAASAFFVVRFLKKRGVNLGKKYLIEQMAHLPMGNKSGVSLIRVGREFFLVGITPQSIQLVSHLPILQAQYEEETKFERATFQDTVDEEIDRLKKQIAL